MDNLIKIKNLELKIEEIEIDIKPLKEELYEKESTLKDLQEELRYEVLMSKTNNINIGDSIVFKDLDGKYIETMLITDSKGHFDLVFLTDCSDISDSMGRGVKMDKKYLYLDSLISDVEDIYNLKFVGEDE